MVKVNAEYIGLRSMRRLSETKHEDAGLAGRIVQLLRRSRPVPTFLRPLESARTVRPHDDRVASNCHSRAFRRVVTTQKKIAETPGAVS